MPMGGSGVQLISNVGVSTAFRKALQALAKGEQFSIIPHICVGVKIGLNLKIAVFTVVPLNQYLKRFSL